MIENEIILLSLKQQHLCRVHEFIDFDNYYMSFCELF